MAYSAIQIANEIIKKGESKGVKYTPLQLIKLTYLAHGWMLGLFDKSLFNDRVEAWRYGPVIPELYQALKCYRNNPIESPIPDVETITLDENEEKVIDYVLRTYQKYDGIDLSRITHAKGTPWEQTYLHDGDYWCNSQIQNHVIQEYYKKLYKQRIAKNG